MNSNFIKCKKFLREFLYFKKNNHFCNVKNWQKIFKHKNKLMIFFGSAFIMYSTNYFFKQRLHNQLINLSTCKINSVYTLEQVKEHGKDSKNGYWTIYKNKVYDITEFVEMHPGGKVIMLAVGAHLDPYFDIYKFHNQSQILEYLDSMFLGYIEENSTFESLKNSQKFDNKVIVNDPFANDPVRSPLLVSVSEKPFNAETPPEILASCFDTNSELFYVRSHLPVPHIDVNNYNLQVCFEDSYLKSNKKAVNSNYFSKLSSFELFYNF